MFEKQTEISKRTRQANQPNAKKKVKIAEKMFPRIADTAKWKVSLTLRTKFTNKDGEAEAKTDGRAIKSIVSVMNCTKIEALYIAQLFLILKPWFKTP